jgi:hypothetical protein
MQAILCTLFISVPTEQESPIEGVGLLQNIWLWRNRPDLSSCLAVVKEPTEIKLRTAGLLLAGLSNHETFHKRTIMDRHRNESLEGKRLYGVHSASTLKQTNLGNMIYFRLIHILRWIQQTLSHHPLCGLIIGGAFAYYSIFCWW